MLVHEGKAYVTSVCDLDVFRGCWWTIRIFPIFYSITRFCVQVYAIRVFVNLHTRVRSVCVVWLERNIAGLSWPLTGSSFISGLLRNIYGCKSHPAQYNRVWGKVTRSQRPEQQNNGAFSVINFDFRWKSLDDTRLSSVLRTLESSTGNTPWEKNYQSHRTARASRRKSLRKGRRKRKCVPDAARSSWLSVLLSALVLDLCPLPYIFWQQCIFVFNPIGV